MCIHLTACPGLYSLFPLPHSVLLVAMVTTHGAVDCCNSLLAHTTVGCYGYHTDYLSSTHHRWLLWLSSSCCDVLLWLQYMELWTVATPCWHTPLWAVMVTTQDVVTTSPAHITVGCCGYTTREQWLLGLQWLPHMEL